MIAVWTDKKKFETWLGVEYAVVKAMAERGLVPDNVPALLHEANGKMDPKRIAFFEEETKHDVIAFLRHLEELVGTEAMRYVHMGLTSSDVCDTAFAMQLRSANMIVHTSALQLDQAIHTQVIKYKDLRMIGRTHGMHAEPTTLGLVFASWLAELGRNIERLRIAADDLAFGKLSGAVGNYGNIDPEVERLALEMLDLNVEPCATQVVPRDRHAAYFNVLSLMASTIERMALQVRHWQRSEVDEVREPFSLGQKGSSAMPHKRNPILSENLCGLSRVMRGYASMAQEDIALWHERDISHSSVERIIAPDATILLDFMLSRALYLGKLDINEHKIDQNLRLSRTNTASSNIFLALMEKGHSREKAYEIAQEWRTVPEVVLQFLSDEEYNKCLDFERHLAHVDAIIDRI